MCFHRCDTILWSCGLVWAGLFIPVNTYSFMFSFPILQNQDSSAFYSFNYFNLQKVLYNLQSNLCSFHWKHTRFFLFTPCVCVCVFIKTFLLILLLLSHCGLPGCHCAYVTWTVVEVKGVLFTNMSDDMTSAIDTMFQLPYNH